MRKGGNEVKLQRSKFKEGLTVRDTGFVSLDLLQQAFVASADKKRPNMDVLLPCSGFSIGGWFQYCSRSHLYFKHPFLEKIIF